MSTRISRHELWLSLALLAFPCAAMAGVTLPEDILIPKNALAIERHDKDDFQQISYVVNLTFPALALTQSSLEELKNRGWGKCTGYSEEWDNFVDGSGAKERVVFQRFSYWSKNDALLTIISRYYVDREDRMRPTIPDNSRQHVIILKNAYPGIAKHHSISCPS